jgi:membrane protease YdiL (CAAX protease family)
MSKESSADPKQADHFFQVMRGNRSKRWPTIAGGIGILLLWQIGCAVLVFTVDPLHRIYFQRSSLITVEDEAIAAFALMVIGFGPPFLALIAWRKFVEQVPIRTLFTGSPQFRWSLAIGAAAAVAVSSFASSALFDQGSLGPFETRMAQFSWQDWLLLTSVYSLGVLVQSTFEEVFVRGWLLQHISRFLAHSFVAILVTTATFSILHYGHAGWATMIVTFAIGLVFGYSAWRLNGLEAAIGGHIANNFLSALLLGTLVGGNPADMGVMEGVAYGVYLLGFLGFVEAWARFGPSPARQGAA